MARRYMESGPSPPDMKLTLSWTSGPLLEKEWRECHAVENELLGGLLRAVVMDKSRAGGESGASWKVCKIRNPAGVLNGWNFAAVPI